METPADGYFDFYFLFASDVVLLNPNVPPYHHVERLLVLINAYFSHPV